MIVDTDKMRVVDLTHSMTHSMPGWVTHNSFSVSPHKIMDADGYTVHTLGMNTHHGTHMDAGSHMLKGGKPITGYPLSNFIRVAIALDFSGKRNGEAITGDDLKKHEAAIKEGMAVLLHTGWDKKRGMNSEYLYEWPFLNASGAEYLSSRKISMVGTDGMSIAGWAGRTPVHEPITDDALEVHRTLLENDILIIEEMANIGELLDGDRSAQFLLVSTPLKLDGLDGSPVRAFGILERR